MQILIDELTRKIKTIKSLFDSENTNLTSLDDLYSVYPFNKFEFVISHLIAKGVLSLDEYLSIRSAYLERNKYLYIFISLKSLPHAHLARLGLKDI